MKIHKIYLFGNNSWALVSKANESFYKTLKIKNFKVICSIECTLAVGVWFMKIHKIYLFGNNSWALVSKVNESFYKI